MPSPEALDRFIALIESNAHAEAAEEFYSEHTVARENQGEKRIGRAVQVSRERAILAKAVRVESTCVRPALLAGDHVAIRWIFEFQWRDGSVTRMEEVAIQRWVGDFIAEETFFYDPAQMVPRRAPEGAAG